jgi:hypothetical protein
VTEEPPRVPAPPLPKHPYGYSLLLNLALASLLFLFSWVLGGNKADSIFYATAFFVVGTAWTWYRLRRRLARERE